MIGHVGFLIMSMTQPFASRLSWSGATVRGNRQRAGCDPFDNRERPAGYPPSWDYSDAQDVSKSSGVGPSNNLMPSPTSQKTRSVPSCEMTKAIVPGTLSQKR